MGNCLVLLAVFLLVVDGVESATSCKWVSELQTCSWIDYNAWHPGADPKSADKTIGSQLASIEDEECRWAFQAYHCATTFPRCNDNGDGPLPVCRDTCYELIEKCDQKYHGGITAANCDALPETECTSLATILAPIFALIMLAGTLAQCFTKPTH